MAFFLFPMKEGERPLELFKLVGTIIVESKEAIEALRETSEEAKDAGEDISKTGEQSKLSGNNIVSSFSKVAKVGATVVSAIVAVGAAMVAIAENTREYRLEIGKLETAFEAAGHTTEDATATYQELYSVLGETDRAVEASQHIAKLCKNEEQMKAMTDACIGAFALFDDSLPIEGLVEAANETAKTGQVTGVLADALNWAGASEAEFQEKLNACNDEQERAALIIEEMVALYGEAADAYKKNNKDIIAATKAQEKLNAAIARWGAIAEPVATAFKEGLAGAINFAADAFEHLTNPIGAATEAILGSSETAEEAAAKVEGLRAQLAELAEVPQTLWTAEFAQHHTELTVALAEAEARYEELAEAERMAAEAASASSATTSEAATSFATVTEQYVADAQALFEKFAATYEGIYNSVSGWFGLFDQAKTTVKTNVKDMMTAMQSQVDFNQSYTKNLQALKEYGLGSLADAFQSYGAEGAAYAQAIVDAVEQAGGATTEEGQVIIQGFADINQQVTESEESLALTMAKMDGEFETATQNMIDSYEAAIEGLDKSSEAAEAATSTFEAFLEGMNTKLPGILSTMTDFGNQITSALQSGIGSINIPVNVSGGGLSRQYVMGSHADGLDYVPFDGYIAELHKGEMVVPAAEARMVRNGTSDAVANSEVANILMMILDAVQEGNSQEKVFKVNNREFGRMVRGAVNA